MVSELGTVLLALWADSNLSTASEMSEEQTALKLHQCKTKAAELLVSSHNYTTIAKISKLWHRADLKLPVGAQPVKHSMAWAVPMQSFSFGGLGNIYPLQSSAELSAEAKALDHCVDGQAYALSCSKGEKVILSLRSEEGSNLATLELVSSQGGSITLNDQSWRVGQFKGYNNTDVPESAKKLWQHFVRELESGALKIEPQAKPDIISTIVPWTAIELSTGVPLGVAPRELWQHWLKFKLVPNGNREDRVLRGQARKRKRLASHLS